MIVIVDGINRDRFSWIVEETFRLRKRVFCDRLGWDVVIEDGQEHDQFDTLDPTYLVSLDDYGNVVGCMRILQTLGPNMLADVFHAILQGQPAPRSPDIWEATRFCVDTERLKGKGAKTRNSISYVTSEIMIAAAEYARESGVKDAIAVIDPIMNRVMCRSGNAPYDYLGKPTPMGKVTAMAALLDCSEERINRLRDFSGITGDVILPEDRALDLVGDAALGFPPDVEICPSHANLTVETYLSELLVKASETNCDKEMAATLQLIAEVRKASSSKNEFPSVTTHVPSAD